MKAFSAALLATLVPCVSIAASLTADKTYEGQATSLILMPTQFYAERTFITSQKTILCPEVGKYEKVYENLFLTPVDTLDAFLRSELDDIKHMGEKSFKLHMESGICRTLQKGEGVEIVGAQMSMSGCQKAWSSIEYNSKYPNTSSYACFYSPFVMVDGEKHMVPSIHLIDFDQWASEEWLKHKSKQK